MSQSLPFLKRKLVFQQCSFIFYSSTVSKLFHSQCYYFLIVAKTTGAIKFAIGNEYSDSILIWFWFEFEKMGQTDSWELEFEAVAIIAIVCHQYSHEFPILVTECPVVSGTDWKLIETLNSFKMNSLQSSHFSHLNYEVAIKSTFFSLSTLNSVKMVWKWLYGKLYWWKRNENT